MKNNLPIVPREARWAIRMAGSDDAIEEHDSQQAAIDAAVELTGDRESHVVIRRRDGTFQNVLCGENLGKPNVSHRRKPLTNRPIFLGMLAVGAVAGIATCSALSPPPQIRRLLK